MEPIQSIDTPPQQKLEALRDHAFALNLDGRGIKHDEKIGDWMREYDKLKPNDASKKGAWYSQLSYRIDTEREVYGSWHEKHRGKRISNEGHLKVLHQEPDGTMTQLRAIASEDGNKICIDVQNGMHVDGGYGIELPKAKQFRREIEVGLDDAKSIFGEVALTREGKPSNIRDVVQPHLEKKAEQPTLKQKLETLPNLKKDPLGIKMFEKTREFLNLKVRPSGPSMETGKD